MAGETLQSMLANRAFGMNRARLVKNYIDQGYSEPVAAAMATAEMYRRNPSKLSAGEAAPVLDQFNETPASVEEARRTMPMQTATVPSQPVKPMGSPVENQEARLNQMRVINAQSRAQGLPEPYPDVPAAKPIDRSSYPSSLMNTLTQSLGLPGSTQSPPWASAATPAPAAPAASPNAGYEGDSPRERIAVTAVNDILARQREAADRDFGTGDMKFSDETYSASPARSIMSQMRSANPRQSQTQAATAPSQESATLRDLWAAANRPDASAADFFRADRAMQEAIKKGQDVGYYGQAEGKKAGGAVQGKDAAIHKALEIIHHLLTRG